MATEQQIKQLILDLSNDFKESVNRIESSFETTKGHYGDYMNLLSQISKDERQCKIF